MIRDPGMLALARAVTPLAARQYAESRGWEYSPKGYDYGIYLFQHPKEPLRQLQFPIRGDGSDYADAILDAGERMAEIDERALLPLLNDMFLVGADVLRYSVVSPGAQTGTVSLDGGLSLLTGAKQLILSAACSVKNPAKFHPRMSWDEATQMLKSTKLGQTEHDSFVVKIACPVEAVDGANLPHSGEPFVRRATRLLLESADQIVRAIEQNRLSDLEDESISGAKISANFCEALGKMHAVDENSRLVISASWSGLIPQPAAEVPRLVDLAPDYFPVIEAIGQRLRSKAEPKTDIFVGTVEELRGEINADGRRAGEVILAIIHEGEIVQARVMLDAEAHSSRRDGSTRSPKLLIFFWSSDRKDGARVHPLCQSLTRMEKRAERLLSMEDHLLFAHGGCHVFALALRNFTGLPLLAVRERGGRHDHLGCNAGAARLLDCFGWFTLEEYVRTERLQGRDIYFTDTDEATIRAQFSRGNGRGYYSHPDFVGPATERAHAWIERCAAYLTGGNNRSYQACRACTQSLQQHCGRNRGLRDTDAIKQNQHSVADLQRAACGCEIEGDQGRPGGRVIPFNYDQFR